jgi:peroxiredoxin
MRTPLSLSSTITISTISVALLGALASGCGGAATPEAASPESTTSADTKSSEGSDKQGGKAASFSVPSINGGKAELQAGKVTIVDFWATWCEPCKKSFPKLQELYVKYKANGLEIVAISVDDEKGGLSAFATAHGAKFPIGWDDGKKIADKWKPEAMPSTYVVDKDGVIRHIHKGYHDGEELELEKEVKALF